MSAAVTSFGTEVRSLKSAHLHSPASCPSELSSHSTVKRKPIIVHDPFWSYESACELDLISAAKSGDHAAFAELCRRCTKSPKRRILQIVRNREDAEDVLQETLLRAYKNLSSFRANCKFQTWLTTIAINTSLMLLRKRRNHAELGFGVVTAEGNEVEVLAISDPSPNPEQLYAWRQASDKIAEAVRKLPPRLRQIIEHCHQREERLEDAANAMGITACAAKSRLLRARTALRRHLKRHVG